MQIEIAKIVGTANEKTWSQVHEFKPEGERLRTHGQLMAALAFKAKKEGVEVSSFGTEIITRLQERYYSNESQSIVKKVAQTMESLAAEFLTEVELQIVVMVIWEKGDKIYLYAGRNSEGQVFLKRGEGLVGLLAEKPGEVGVVSGELEAGDRVVGGTKEFFRMVEAEKVRLALEENQAEEMRESLGTVVQGQENNSQAAAVVVKIDEEAGVVEDKEEDRSEVEVEEEGDKVERKENKWLAMMKQGGEKLKGLAGKIARSGRGFKVGGGGRKRQKSAATVALVLVLVFGLSVGLAGRKRQKAKQEAEYRTVLEEVRYKHDEALGLMELNPLRARSLLKDSQERLESYKAEQEEKVGKEMEEWLEKIKKALSQAQREYEVEAADEWFDFGLVKEGFKGSDWELEEKEVMVWDEASKTVVVIDLESKASRIVVGGDKIGSGKLVGLAGDRGMVVNDELVTIVEMEDGEVVDEVGADEWGEIGDAVGFGENLYLLDKSVEGQIWKYLGVKSGLSSKRSYLKGEDYDLSEAVSMAIDASVWVLFSDGLIVKYTRGEKDAFAVSGLDQEFEEPVKIFTSPEVENIYVLDQRRMRVVVISKIGEYQAQYLWPGMAGVKDVVVSEELKKMFLLTGGKIFTLELK